MESTAWLVDAWSAKIYQNAKVTAEKALRKSWIEIRKLLGEHSRSQPAAATVKKVAAKKSTANVTATVLAAAQPANVKAA
jgi:hypothetical protein